MDIPYLAIVQATWSRNQRGFMLRGGELLRMWGFRPLRALSLRQGSAHLDTRYVPRVLIWCIRSNFFMLVSCARERCSFDRILFRGIFESKKRFQIISVTQIIKFRGNISYKTTGMFEFLRKMAEVRYIISRDFRGFQKFSDSVTEIGARNSADPPCTCVPVRLIALALLMRISIPPKCFTAASIDS